MTQKVLTLSAGGIVTEIVDASQPQLSGTGFVKASGTTISYDASTYLTTAGTAADSSKLGGALANTFAPLASPTFTGSVNMAELRASTAYNTTVSTGITPIARLNNGGAVSLWVAGNGYTSMWIQAIQDDGSNNLKSLSINPLGGSVGFGSSITATTCKVTSAGGYISSDNSTGITTTVTTASLVGKTITIKDGIITGFA